MVCVDTLKFPILEVWSPAWWGEAMGASGSRMPREVLRSMVELSSKEILVTLAGLMGNHKSKSSTPDLQWLEALLFHSVDWSLSQACASTVRLAGPC